MTALTDMLLRSTVTRGRLAAGCAGGVVLVGLAVLVLLADGGTDEARQLVEEAGLALLVPVISVVFATAVLGDPADDGTIAYLLTTPQPRWRIALPALAATLTVVLPLVVVPLVAVLLIAGLGVGPVLALAGGTVAGTMAYSAVFLALGVWVRRGLLVGLLYSAIWEGVVAGVGEGLARLSIRAYLTTAVDWLDPSRPVDGPVDGPVALVVLALLVLGGLALTTLLLRHHVARN